ncbi:trigger factor [Candidatus Kuenenbacteria bacterium]|nr:trigger factor [Candidatus Kuenenbacteria bacterium]
MKVTKSDLPKAQAELIVELSHDELKPYLENAAVEFSKNKKIQGFRPGKAPFDLVVKEVGEMTVYQSAASQAIQGTIYKVLEEQNLEIVDQPTIEVQKLAPGNPFTYKATVSLVPNIEVCEYSTIKVKPLEKIKIEEKEIEKVLNDLKKMKGKEVLENKSAENGDKAELDFETFVDNVAIEGGQAKKHQLVLGEGRMIPGFEENVLGMKKDEEKEFKLTFPKEYHEKTLQNKEATFKIKVTAVFKIEQPELNDEFAKELGLPTLDALKKNIKTNLTQEKESKDKQRQELELIEHLVEKSKFEDIPDELINQETHKMLHELQDNIAKQGMKFEDYLTHIKKTEADMRLDFTPDAIKRVKTALIIRLIAKKENIKVEDKDVEEEIERTLANYKMNPGYAAQLDELEKNLRSDNARHYFVNFLTNRKTMEFLKEKIIKE